MINRNMVYGFLGVGSFVGAAIAFWLTSDDKSDNNSNDNGFIASMNSSEQGMSTQNHSGQSKDSESIFTNFSEKFTHGDPAVIAFTVCMMAALALIIMIARKACSPEGLGKRSSGFNTDALGRDNRAVTFSQDTNKGAANAPLAMKQVVSTGNNNR